MADFTIPDFLAAYSEEAVYQQMRAMLPADIDSSEGSHVWNFLRPTASAVAELCQFVLPQVIMTIFPAWAEGEYLDAHAQVRGLTRRPAAAATGSLTITGTPGADIPKDSRFSTASAEDRPAAEYATLSTVTIGAGGTVSAAVQCTQAGPAGNTAPDTVVLVSGRMPSVTGVTNPEAITGGSAEESDDELRERIMDYDTSQGESFVGSAADYRRWAHEVPGVGGVTVLDADDGQGTVTIVLTDSDGLPATEVLCQAVYNAIMRPDNPDERQAPVNARLEVVPPDTLPLAVQATVELETGVSLESVTAAFLQALTVYMTEALEEGEVKYTRVAAALSATEGVSDFSGLLIGVKSASTQYGTGNIPVEALELPTIADEDLHLTEGTV